MSILEGHGEYPGWEPIPWDSERLRADEQKRGFLQRACKPLVWTKVDWNHFPDSGIFGRDRDWFVKHNIAYVTTNDGEDLVLIQNSWHGFPDPPEWGLASRPAEKTEARWEMWGHFPKLPTQWLIPE